MANSRSSASHDSSAAQAPSFNTNEWVEVQRRHQQAPLSSLNVQDIGQYVPQLGPEEPWDGIAMLHTSQAATAQWSGQWHHQSQSQSYGQETYVEQQQQQEYSSQQYASTQADHGSQRSEQQRKDSRHGESHRDAKSKKKSKSKSSRSK